MPAITYPKGFTAAGAACGLKGGGALDLALVCCDAPAVCAGIFTRNVVKGHSLQLTARRIQAGSARAVVINSGCANACLGAPGDEAAQRMAGLAADALRIPPEHVLTGSTGVIGKPLDLDKIAAGIARAAAGLSIPGGEDAARAIMTTDTYAKQAQADCVIGGRTVRIGGMAKGSGMIYPDMATMIAVLTTDAAIAAPALDAALRRAADKSFNRVCVDGDTSVCDMVVALAGGRAGNPEITLGSQAFELFCAALEDVCARLARMLAADGEGATKLIEVRVHGAPTQRDALLIAQAIAKSPLVKTAAYGCDANWGRLLTAAGYSGAQFDPSLVDIYMGDLQTCEKGCALPFDEQAALTILQKEQIHYTLELNQGEGRECIWTCDLSHEYITINGSYRT